MKNLNPNTSIAELEEAIVEASRQHSRVILGCVFALLAAIGVVAIMNRPDLLWVILPLLVASVFVILQSERSFGPKMFEASDLLLKAPGLLPLKIIINRVLNHRRLARKAEIRSRFLARFSELLASGERDLELTLHEQGVIFGFASAVLINPTPTPEEEMFGREVLSNAAWLLDDRQRMTLEFMPRIRSFNGTSS